MFTYLTQSGYSVESASLIPSRVCVCIYIEKIWIDKYVSAMKLNEIGRSRFTLKTQYRARSDPGIGTSLVVTMGITRPRLS